jgi:lipoyl(octanoyl) transferase
VFTQGLAGKPEHLLLAGDIPLIASNRGGQITFHGPGQVMAYALIDLKRAGYFVKEYVYRIEDAVLKTLAHAGVTGHRVAGAPGIYVRPDAPFDHARLPSHPKHGQSDGSPDFTGLAKIAALGVKVSRHCAYHGVALNVRMDLSPFERINPCGYAGLATTDLFTIGVDVSWQDMADVLGSKLATSLMP